MAIAFFLFGIASLSPEVTMGLGMFPYLAGIFIGASATGIFMGALVYLAVSSVRSRQKENFKKQLNL